MNNRQNHNNGSTHYRVSIRHAQDCQLLDELDNWKLVCKFRYLQCFHWCRIKFYGKVVELIQNSF